MDVAHLAHAPLIRRLAAMFALGAVLVPVRAALWAAPPAPLRVEVAAPVGASAADVARAVEEAVLADQGIRAGWARTDPAIRRRLIDDLRFADVAGPDDDVLALALDLGLHRADPVVRGRLVTRAEDVLAAAPTPDDRTLAAYLDAHPERFAVPARLSVAHVFVGEGDAEVARARVVAGDPVASAPMSPLGPLWTGSPADLDARLGPGFAAAATAAPGWHVVRSAFGAHLVRVTVAPARIPPLAEIRPAVLASWRHDRRAEAVREGTAALVARYEVTLR